MQQLFSFPQIFKFMNAINFSHLQLVPNDVIRVYSKAQDALQGTFLLKSEFTLYCRTNTGLREIPLKEIERIVIVSPTGTHHH
jgi:hypothetical protein